MAKLIAFLLSGIVTLVFCLPGLAQGLGARISVATAPDQAAVTCDGVARGLSPLSLSGLQAGPHLIVVEKEGYLPAQRTVTVTAEGRSTVDIKMEQPAGLVLLTSHPVGAEIEINGAHRGKTPLLLTDLPFGKYRLKASALGYLNRDVEFAVENRTPQQVRVTLTSDSAVLTIKTEPPGASVKVNGLSKGETPCTLDRLPAGDNEVVLSLPGHVVYRSIIKLQANQEETVEVPLKPLPAVLSVVTIPTGARLFVDEKLSGQSPLTLDAIEVGSHVVRAELDGYTPVSRTLEFQQGEKKVEEIRLEREVGVLEVMAKPEGIRVFVDGIDQGGVLLSPDNPIPRFSQELAVGAHVVSLRLKGHGAVERRVVVEKGQTNSVKEVLKRVFLPDTRIKLRNGEVLTGVFGEKLANGDVRLETQIGIYKTIELMDIAKMESVKN